MRYLLLIYEDERLWEQRGEEATAEMFAAYRKYTGALKEAGVFLGGDALQPITSATTVRVRGGRATTTDGPFAETKEQLGGFYMIEAQDLDEALRWAEQLPASATGSVEVRPIAEYG